MVKEAKNINFYTTGREPSEQDFKHISEWIQLKKENAVKRPATAKKSTVTNNSI